MGKPGIYFATRRCPSCGWVNTHSTIHSLTCPGEIEDIPLVSYATAMGEVQTNTSDQTVEIRTTSSTGAQKGVKDAEFSLIPVGPLTSLAVHYHRGAKKYAKHNWRAGYEWSKSIDALARHFFAFNNGEDYDVCPEDHYGCSEVTVDGDPYPRTESTCYNHTGSHHLDGVAFHTFALREFVETHPEFDDRYKPGQ